ncbi:hypothetical protein [Pseudomonas sp. Irchel 3A5]|uniref:hypothetical protein n=1 Tax=Pseudomonas sp. Irchel 3A5 TaxID=2008911 RepID=UPI000BA45759|nr:hypothetical protein [Pseudomonas sp. Irchel 3A5]
MRCLLALSFLFFPFLASAASPNCETYLSSWAKTLHPTLAFDKQRSACKTANDDPDHTLAVLVLVEEKAEVEDDPEGLVTYGLEIISAKKGVIESHVYESNAIEISLFKFSGLSLDPTSYQLNPDAYTFGVILKHNMAIEPFTRSITQLNFYTIEGKKVRKILEMEKDIASAEQNPDSCAGSFLEGHLTLSIGNNSNHGYADLEVAEKVIATEKTDTGNGCTKEEKPTSNEYVLIYNGERYNPKY